MLKQLIGVAMVCLVVALLLLLVTGCSSKKWEVAVKPALIYPTYPVPAVWEQERIQMCLSPEAQEKDFYKLKVE